MDDRTKQANTRLIHTLLYCIIALMIGSMIGLYTRSEQAVRSGPTTDWMRDHVGFLRGVAAIAIVAGSIRLWRAHSRRPHAVADVLLTLAGIVILLATYML